MKPALDPQPRSQSTRSPLLSRAGFSLIELMLSIAILAVLAALTFPSMNGIYNRQLLINTANEMVTSIKRAQNMALSNNQQPYDRPPYVTNSSHIINDCLPNKPYISAYEVRVQDSGSYYIQRNYQTTRTRGPGSCPPPPSQQWMVGSTIDLPPSVSLTGSSFSNIHFATTTGQLSTTPATNPARAMYQLNHVGIPASSLTYYVCIDQGRVYASSETCSW